MELSNKFGQKVFLCVPISNYGKHTLTILETLVHELSIVDYFVFVECNQDYSGKSKPLLFKENEALFENFKDRIIYSSVDLPKDNTLIQNIFYHYEQFNNLLSTAEQDDIVILSEDNIVFNNQVLISWTREAKTLFEDRLEPIIFKLHNFRYFLNLKITNDMQENKTLFCLKKFFDPLFHFNVQNVDNLRSNSLANGEIIGWQFRDLNKYPIFGTDINNRKGNMFSGQIKNIGKVTSINDFESYKEILIECPEILQDMKIEDAVSVNGFNSSISKINEINFAVNISNESIENSALSEITVNSKVNLELSERYDFFDLDKLPSYVNKFFDDSELFYKIPVIKPNPPQIKNWAKYLSTSYETNTFSNNGPCVKLLENRLKDYLNLQHSPILMNNATIGLTVAIRAFNLKNCDILMPSFTFSATAHSVLNAECNPILVDIENNGIHLCLQDAENKLTGNTKAIIVVQALGFPCDYQKYEEFAKKHNLILIFDSAAALGASYSDNNKVGQAGDCEVFSLHITKTFGIGEGCLISSKNLDFIENCRKIINFGFTNNSSTSYGTNAKCSEFHAAIGLSVLDCINDKIDIKRQKSDYYKEKFLTLNLKTINIENSGFQVFPLLLANKQERDFVCEALTKNAINFKIYYTPIHLQPYFENILSFSELQNTEILSDKILCLPFYETISTEEIDKIIAVVAKALE
jgi:dTDP-4-amino-4,6-dideoxygalactose transaminase